MASILRSVYTCIAVTCLFIGGCADAPVSAARSPTEASISSNAMQATDWYPKGGSSVHDGVFTVEQSRRGAAKYMKTCKKCHLRDLAGDWVEDAPPLVGDEFLSNWAQWSVGDLFEFMTLEMPPKPKDRRDLTAENYADILAFILEKNGFPVGAAELPPELEPLITIEMSPSE